MKLYGVPNKVREDSEEAIGGKIETEALAERVIFGGNSS